MLDDLAVYRGSRTLTRANWATFTLQFPGGFPECLCGSRGCFERLCCGMWLERDYGKTAEELMKNPAFVETYVVDFGAGIEGGGDDPKSGAHRDRRGNCKSWGRVVRTITRRTAETGDLLVAREAGRGAGRTGRRQRPVRLLGGFLSNSQPPAGRPYSLFLNRLSNAARASLAFLGAAIFGAGTELPFECP